MEGLLIGEAQEGTLMNRRGEWGQNLPPKLEIEDPVNSLPRLQFLPKPTQKESQQSNQSKVKPNAKSQVSLERASAVRGRKQRKIKL